MLPLKMSHAALTKHREHVLTLVTKAPWLIPVTLTIEMLPFAISAHGFWKTRQLSKQLKIEREKTKQLALQQVETATTFAKKGRRH
ncbi:transposase [Lactobacillus sp. CBA3606]|uniref:transposase n=1 Tax=Lactobacillus sp. CBA3606 TaxID=2099789 RepID=UPI000CFBFF10|nr:transposase [Lactobacillus sp. CBA3606]AVK64617.1 transposase [Lactobacillus sp. CBA3606]